jgi:hypothetical protein
MESEFGGAPVLENAAKPVVVIDVATQQRVDIFVLFEMKVHFGAGAAADVPGSFQEVEEDFAFERNPWFE